MLIPYLQKENQVTNPLYSPHTYVSIRPDFGRFARVLEAKDIYRVDTCENIPGRTHTILFCTNIVTGEKREISSAVVQGLLSELVNRLIDIEIETLLSHVENLRKNQESFSR